jgi:cytochrome oxidase Cu insertion factor (SCO1/SenC/PrrC family)
MRAEARQSARCLQAPPLVARCAALLLLLVAALLSSGCGEDSPVPTPTASTAATAKPASAVRILGRAPWFKLTDQRGRSLQTEQLIGQVWIANFMFTSCRATCPLQTKQLLALQAERAEHPDWTNLHFVSFTVDPATDNVERLRAYTSEKQVDDDTWSFLTGPRRVIWKLSDEGFLLPAGDDPENEDMPIAHSAMFVVVDRRGFIRAYCDSQTDEGIAELKQVLAEVLAEPTPTVTPDPPWFDGKWLDERTAEQQKKAAGYKAFHDFHFEDRRSDSGIEFVHRCVDDAGKYYKAVHYDHGNGIAVADVDGDGLLDVYFSNQVGSNQLWRNAGDGTFEDITEDAGVAVRGPVGVTASFADVDNDGDPDLYVTTVRGGNVLFENKGDGSFQDITKQAGLTYSGHSSGAVFFDYDNDGLLDLFLTNVGVYTNDKLVENTNDLTVWGQEKGTFSYYEGVTDAFSGHIKPKRTERSILYRNLGMRTFRDVTMDVGLLDDCWTGDASPIDVNDDGWMDLYIPNMQGHDQYYENQKGVVFKRRGRKIFPKTPWGTMGIKSFDYDNDGDFDLFLTDMHSDMSQRVIGEDEKRKADMVWAESILRSEGKSLYGNAFFRKTGPDQFEEVSDAIGVETYWPWGVSVGDLNADGFLDAFITASMNYKFRYGVNSLLLNEGGTRFVDAEFVVGVEPRQGRSGKPWCEYDCSGADASLPECEGQSGTHVHWAPLGSRASVLFDLDGDGDLDIITNEFNAEPMVLVSDLSTRRTVNQLSIRLIGTKSNRDGLGAVVQVRAGTRTYTQRNDGRSGYLSQSAMPLYFGLDDATRVDEIVVRWPSGATQTIAGPLEANRTLDIREE